MKHIVHIFPASTPHLTNPLVRRFAEFVDESIKQTFLIYGKCSDWEELDSLVQQTDHCEKISGLVALCNYILRHRKASYILHSSSFPITLVVIYMLVRRISWVCWGAGVSKTYGLKKICKSWLYSRLYCIITLMRPDKDSLWDFYNVSLNVLVAPYPSCNSMITQDFKESQSAPLRVLLGNNGHCIQSYFQILPMLARFAHKIELHCMFQYPDWPQEKEKIFEEGSRLFGGSFVLDDQLMDRQEYMKYIASFDVYVCHHSEQTGLGAIRACLESGVKVYINGKNLSWMKECGVVINDSCRIEHMNFEEFSAELSIEEKRHNRHMMLDVHSKERDQIWHDILRNKL